MGVGSGVVGLKATYGRVSKAGVMPHTWSLDNAGPLTRRVEDAALTLRVIAGFDPRDPGSADMPVGDYLASLKKGIRGLRVGVPREHFWDRIESGVEPVVRQALRDLEEAGARVDEVSIPHMAGALGAILVTEMASVTAWHDTYLRQPDRRARYTPEVRALMDAGKFIFATDFLKAQRLRRVLTDEVRAAFAGVDVLATPTLPLCGWEVSQSHVEIAGNHGWRPVCRPGREPRIDRPARAIVRSHPRPRSGPGRPPQRDRLHGPGGPRAHRGSPGRLESSYRMNSCTKGRWH